jgi:hypothetical protein
MATGAGDEVVEKPQGGAPAPAGGADGANKGQPPPEPAKPPKEAAAAKPDKEGAAKPPKEEPKRVRLKDDDEIPDDTDAILELSHGALKKRLERHTARELKARYGTDDADDIAARLKEHGELKAAKEADRKAKLDEATRLKEEKQAAEAKAEAAEQRARAVEDERDVDKQDATLREAASSLVKTSAKHWKHISRDFADYMADEKTPKQLEAMSEKDMVKEFKKWAPEYLKEMPEYAATAAPPNAKPLDESVRTDDEPPADKGNGAKPGAGPKPVVGSEDGKGTKAWRANLNADLKKAGITP